MCPPAKKVVIYAFAAIFVQLAISKPGFKLKEYSDVVGYTNKGGNDLCMDLSWKCQDTARYTWIQTPQFAIQKSNVHLKDNQGPKANHSGSLDFCYRGSQQQGLVA